MSAGAPVQSVELKLTEQRKFVLWWDGQEKQAGARGVGKKVEFQTGNPTLNQFGVDKLTLHRWRTRLKDEGKFQESLETAQERCVRVCEASKGQTDQQGDSAPRGGDRSGMAGTQRRPR